MGMDPVTIAAIAAVAIPALTAVGKEVFSSSDAGSVSQAGADKMKNMQQAASAYGAYRPDQADARMKAMAQQLSAYQGAGNMMQAMYGGTGGGGGYTPGGGGYTPTGPVVQGPDKPPGYIPGRPDFTPKNNDGSIKGTPSGAPDGGGPPIVVVGPGGIGYDGPAPGSSGTSLVGPTPPVSPMAALLSNGVRNSTTAVPTTPMAALLAKQARS